MVALATNTTETPTWDILETFPKLHSRAREAITPICTEARYSKSLSCVEIWLTIYEGCVGLESFTRDPIGYKESELDLYAYVNGHSLSYTDPDGLVPQPPLTLPGGPAVLPGLPYIAPVAPVGPTIIPGPTAPQVLVIQVCTVVFYYAGQKCVRPSATKLCYYWFPSKHPPIKKPKVKEPRYGDWCGRYECEGNSFEIERTFSPGPDGETWVPDVQRHQVHDPNGWRWITCNLIEAHEGPCRGW